jgi:hypothetical protein
MKPKPNPSPKKSGPTHLYFCHEAAANLVLDQADQIERIFDHWAVVYFT